MNENQSQTNALEDTLRRFQRGRATWEEALEALLTNFPRHDPTFLAGQLVRLDMESRAIHAEFAASLKGWAYR
jgi:hypothetical protein